MSIKPLLPGMPHAGALPVPGRAATNAQAGLATGCATRFEPLTPASGQPVAKAPYVQESGKPSRIDINAGGSAELATEGPRFFRKVGRDELDDEGTARVPFVAIRPGTCQMRVPGTTSERQCAVFDVG